MQSQCSNCIAPDAIAARRVSGACANPSRFPRRALQKCSKRGYDGPPRGASREAFMPGRHELIKPKGDKRYVRRNPKGQFKESDDVGRSLAADRRKKAKTAVKPGQGDKGDRQR